MKEEIEISKEKFEQIEDYLLNKMSSSDRKVFEEKIENDARLKKEVDVQNEIMLAVQAEGMKNKLEDIHQKLTKSGGSSKWYLAAASITILIAVGIWLILKPDKSEKLFASNMSVDPGLPVPMSSVDDYVFYDAMVDYKSGKYDLALGKWKSILRDNPNSDTLNYFVGVTSFNLEKYNNAIPYLQIVAKQDASVFYGKSEWYLALSFLATKDFDRLNSLANNSHSNYTEQINELVQKLE